MYHENDDPIKSINLFRRGLNNNIDSTYETLNNILLDAYKLLDIELMLLCLDKIKEMDKHPYPSILKRLGYEKNLPEVLFMKLNEFDMKFGYLVGKVMNQK